MIKVYLAIIYMRARVMENQRRTLPANLLMLITKILMVRIFLISIRILLQCKMLTKEHKPSVSIYLYKLPF